MRERATLHLGFAATAAGFFRDYRIFMFFGLGDIIGFGLAFIVFQVQIKQGLVYKAMDRCSSLFVSGRKQKVVASVPSTARKHKEESAVAEVTRRKGRKVVAE